MEIPEILNEISARLDAMAAEEKTKHAESEDKVRIFAEGYAFGLQVVAAMLRDAVKEYGDELASPKREIPLT